MHKHMKKVSAACTTVLIEKSPQALPAGAGCIASALKNSDLTKDICSVKLKAFCLEERGLSRLKSFDSQGKFVAEQLWQLLCENAGASAFTGGLKVVCFSMYVWNRKILECAAEELRKNGVICIAGGPEVTAHPQVFTAFDYLTCGEGEETVPALINALANGSRPENKIIYSKPCDLSKLASPYLDGTINVSEYGGALWELARGCPFKCSYCYESKGENKVRYFPMERIEKELKLFAQKKVPQVFVLDPTYNASKKRAIELINFIAEYTPDTFYYFEARGEFIDRELAHAFTKITCALQIGLQSASEEVLRLVNRPFNKKQFVKNIGFLNEEGITFGLDLIYGLPGESLKGFKESIDFAIELYPNNLELFCLSVLPGTDLYERAEQLELSFEKEPPYHVLKTSKIGPVELKEAEKLSMSCSYFYNDGRAVPWFNTVCRSLKLKPSAFFKQFADFMLKEQNGAVKIDCSYSYEHREIEKNQLEFVALLYKERHMEKYVKVAQDLIKFNGALSRTLDTGESETVTLFYDSEYLASEYASDLQFFVQNIRPKANTITTFKKGGTADWKTVKNKSR